MQVAKNKVVAIEYVLTDDDKDVLDRSDDGEPLEYLHGAGNIIPGLEAHLDGKEVGDQLEVTIPPADGYGERNEELRQAVPREAFEDIDDLELGMQFQVETEEGGHAIVSVVEINDDEITIDGNHDLAGMNLHFKVKVCGIREPTKDELDHGHVHSAGCNHDHG